MQRILLAIGLMLSLALPAAATAQTVPPTGGLPPWWFGMSPQEVTSQVDAGPYKSFTNGDLETYNGLFDGRKENVQFFFKEGKLVRIGVYLYEGEDIKAASKVWATTYRALKAKYGAVELPDVIFDAPTAAPESDLVGIVAGGMYRRRANRRWRRSTSHPMRSSSRVFAATIRPAASPTTSP